ncbi:MAG: hypothetical protein HN389_12205 [Clostridia bacterium]|jgi:hypothetical protein|nr:hypothetical protein [Clostridia bacterium]
MEVNLTEILIALVGIVFTGVIIPLVRVAFVWLREKTQNEALLSAIEEARMVADGVVAGLQVNIVEGLKEKSTDGKLMPEEAKEIMEVAIGQFLCDLSSRTLAVIENNSDDAAEYIANLIEARLALSKK